jgi:hypothetical protein
MIDGLMNLGNVWKIVGKGIDRSRSGSRTCRDRGGFEIRR